MVGRGAEHSWAMVLAGAEPGEPGGGGNVVMADISFTTMALWKAGRESGRSGTSLEAARCWCWAGAGAGGAGAGAWLLVWGEGRGGERAWAGNKEPVASVAPSHHDDARQPGETCPRKLRCGTAATAPYPSSGVVPSATPPPPPS